MPQPNQDKSQPDDPRQAVEEGDAQTTGRQRGRPVDQNDAVGESRTSPEKPGDKNSESSEHWESGRQRAN